MHDAPPRPPEPVLPTPALSGLSAAELAATEGRFDVRDEGLRRHTARGTIVNAVYLIGVSSLGLLRGFVVAAYLTASDYGIWGILVVGLGTLIWLKEVGIGDKYVQQAEADQELAFQKAFTLELLFSGVFFVALLVTVPLLALVYDQPALIGPGLVISLIVPAARAADRHQRLLPAHGVRPPAAAAVVGPDRRVRRDHRAGRRRARATGAS